MAKTKGTRSARDVKEEKKAKQPRGDGDAGPSRRVSTGSKNGIKVSPEDKEYIELKINFYKDQLVENDKLNEHDLRECVSEVMRYMLAASHRKPEEPVKHTLIVDLLKKLQAKKQGISTLVVPKAQSQFNTFGMEMATVALGASKAYVMRSLLPRQFIIDYVHTDADKALDGLKACVLTFLHLHGDKASEDELWGHLTQLGFVQSPEVHPAFGASTEVVLTRLIDRKYLKATVSPDTGERVYSPGDAVLGEFGECSGAALKAHAMALMEHGGGGGVDPDE